MSVPAQKPASQSEIQELLESAIKRVNDVRYMELFTQYDPDVDPENFMPHGKRLNVEGVHLRLEEHNYPVDIDPRLTLCGKNADAENLCFYVTEPGSRYDLPTMIELKETCSDCRSNAQNIIRMIALAGTSV